MLNDKFLDRHIGPNNDQIQEMLQELGLSTIEDLINKAFPDSILLDKSLDLASPKSEYEVLQDLISLSEKNKQYKNHIGLGYYDTMTPPVVQRNVLENPTWYTSYTPYQAEISQGRLEALLNFQTAVAELTGMDVANASLLCESTSAAEAMRMFFDNRSAAQKKAKANVFFVDNKVFPQTKSVLLTRAEPLGIKVVFGNIFNYKITEQTFGLLVQYPNKHGEISNYAKITDAAHQTNCKVVVAADILSLSLLKPPGEWGADAVVGSTQRLGLPLGFGGPHVGYFACSQKYIRKMPGRIIGVSKDKGGKIAYRMTLQTREQHIKRERATSNICTAQALLAIMSGFYAIYHGYEGIRKIAENIHFKANMLSKKLKSLGIEQINERYFDTLRIKIKKSKKEKLSQLLAKNKININLQNSYATISIDEITSIKDLNNLVSVFVKFTKKKTKKIKEIDTKINLPKKFLRSASCMQQEVFKKYRTETKMMRYMKQLERRDISLTHSMIPLGSCTMKLNSAVSMLSLSNPGYTNIHPFAPEKQTTGYLKLISSLKKALVEITGMDDLSFQPNSGASGEYSGLMTIRAYQKNIGQGHRDICLIPESAHGTNPASAIMAGYKIITVKSDKNGNVDVDDLIQKAEAHKYNLGAFMITYPSTHGVFEKSIIKICHIVHQNGGQVYMDGANMNAQIGVTNPGFIGADVCHLNLHKTFAIPHGGGGPGVGPIAVKKHLAPFLPGHPINTPNKHKKATEAVSAAPYGSALILTISYAFIKMLGAKGLKKSAIVAILNANYIATKLKDYFPVLYTAETGYVAHELILDLRNLKHELNITEADITKRLMDFGFHAPTVSFPVHGTLMIEPTESESKEELDRFIEAMKIIHSEIEEIRTGKADKEDNVIKNAPHPEYEIVNNKWEHPYSREKAAYPVEWVRENKFWINVGKIDDAYGDRKTFCNIVTPEFEKQVKK